MAPGDLGAISDDAVLVGLLRAAGLAFDSLVRTHARVKPGHGALVGFTLHRDDGEELYGYVRTGTPARIATLVDKWERLQAVPTAFGPGVRALPGGEAALFLFPNDAGLRGLRDFVEIRKLKRALADLPEFGAAGWRIRGRRSAVRIVRYKPEQRLIARVELGCRRDGTGETEDRQVFLRVFSDARGRRLFETQRALWESGLAGAMPRPLGVLAGGRAAVETAVQGVPLLDDRGAPRLAAGLVLGLLARLRAARIPGAAVATPGDRLRRARQTGDFLRRAGDAIASRVDRLLARLAAARPVSEESVTIHGDLHLHQVLVTADGPVLVDFERCGRGHAAEDPAFLAAHARVLARRDGEGAAALRTFAEVVEARTLADAAPADARAFAWYRAAAFLEMALLPFRRREPSWETEVSAVLRLAEDAVEAAGGGAAALRWSALHPARGAEWSCLVDVGAGRPVPGIYRVEDGTVERVDPADDPALPGLARRLDGGVLRSYRVGRRAMVECGAGDARRFVKVVRPRRTPALIARLEAVAVAAGDVVRIPRMLARDPEAGVIEFEALVGTPLHETLMRAERVLRERVLERVGRDLAAFHGIRIDGEATALPRLDPEGALDDWIDHVGRSGGDAAVHRDLRARIADLPGALRAGDRLLHGDLHDKNVFRCGDRLALIDLDGAGRGDPLGDLGNLAAHVVLRGRQRGEAPGQGEGLAIRLAAAWRGAGGDFDADVLRRAVAATLLRLACIYALRRPWQGLVPGLLEDTRRWTTLGL